LLNAVVRTLDERREQAVKINWRESVWGRGCGKCKGPEVEAWLVYARNSKEGCIVKAAWVRREWQTMTPKIQQKIDQMGSWKPVKDFLGAPRGSCHLSQGPGSALRIFSWLCSQPGMTEQSCQKLCQTPHVLWTSMKFTISQIVIIRLGNWKRHCLDFQITVADFVPMAAARVLSISHIHTSKPGQSPYPFTAHLGSSLLCLSVCLSLSHPLPPEILLRELPYVTVCAWSSVKIKHWINMS
jgi:hypothetical protein